MRTSRFGVGALLVASVFAGCNGLIGLDEPEPLGTACVPGSTRACYTGGEGTLDVGVCRAGLATCTFDGSGYGPCAGEVVPTAEDCATALDEDCDGLTSDDGADGCVCAPGALAECYQGPASTKNKGSCRAGVMLCDNTGTLQGACIGQTLPAFEGCTTPLVDTNCDGSTGCKGAYHWGASFGSNADIGESTLDVTAGPGARVVIAGVFRSGSLDLGSGPLFGTGASDGFVAAFDSAGSPLWSKAMSSGQSPNDAQCTSVAVTGAGDVVVAGTFSSSISFGGSAPQQDTLPGPNAFVAALDDTGELRWGRSADGTGGAVKVERIAIDPQGNATVAGAFSGKLKDGTTQLSASGSDIFVWRLDAAGKTTYLKQFGSDGDQGATDVASLSDGNALVAGSFAGVLPLGATTLQSAGQKDVFIFKLAPGGNASSPRGFGGAGMEEATAFATVPTGGVVIVGRFGPAGSTFDLGAGPLVASVASTGFVARLDEQLDCVWSLPLGALDPRRVAVDAAGNVIVAGTAKDKLDLGGGPLPTIGQLDLVVLKLNLYGEHVFSKRFGGVGSTVTTSVATDGIGDILVAGSINADVAFDSAKPLDAIGKGADAFVVSLSP